MFTSGDVPTGSFEEARVWRETCASPAERRPAPKQIARLLEEESNDSGTGVPGRELSGTQTHPFPLPSIDSLRDALDAAICAQEQAFCLVLEAIGEAKDSKMAMLLAVHNRALEHQEGRHC